MGWGLVLVTVASQASRDPATGVGVPRKMSAAKGEGTGQVGVCSAGLGAPVASGVLSRTMDYLVTQIMDQTEGGLRDCKAVSLQLP